MSYTSRRYQVTDVDHVQVWARTLYNGAWYAWARGQYGMADKMARASLVARQEARYLLQSRVRYLFRTQDPWLRNSSVAGLTEHPQISNDQYQDSVWGLYSASSAAFPEIVETCMKNMKLATNVCGLVRTLLGAENDLSYYA